MCTFVCDYVCMIIESLAFQISSEVLSSRKKCSDIMYISIRYKYEDCRVTPRKSRYLIHAEIPSSRVCLFWLQRLATSHFVSLTVSLFFPVLRFLTMSLYSLYDLPDAREWCSLTAEFHSQEYCSRKTPIRMDRR